MNFGLTSLGNNGDTASWRLINFHLRRLLYDEIKEFEKRPNFMNAKVVGYCLNVMGISEKSAKGEDFEPVRRAAINAVKAHYLKLAEDYPAVAEAVLMEGMTFEPAEKRLVKTFSGMLGKAGERRYLELTEPPP